MSSILWLAKTHPQLNGHLFIPPYFKEIADNLLLPFLNWKTYSPNNKATTIKDMLTDKEAPWIKNGFSIRVPHDVPINGTSCHLIDAGFIFYASMSPPPEDGNFYPTLDLSRIPVFPLPNPGPTPLENKFYAVLTSGATYENRVLSPKAFNGMADYLNSKNITPVFLGSKSVGTRKVIFDEGYDYSKGIDLREKTTLLQAAKIISQAKFIAGLDNGLLHLAAMTSTPIIFGYNIASPEYRRPRRKQGAIYDIYPDPTYLTCTFCLSKMRFMFDHDFAKCLYKDNKCLDELSDPKDWCRLIDQCLSDQSAV